MQVVVGASGPDEAVTVFANDSSKTGVARRRSRDSSARRPQAVLQEERSFSRLTAGGEASLSEIVILDSEGRIVAVNHPWRETLAANGFPSREAVIGAPYVDVARRLLGGPDAATLEADLQRLLEGGAEEVRLTCVSDTPGGLRWRHVQITPLSDGGSGRFVAVHGDPTQLAAARAALKADSEAVLAARDDERQRIAIELHDSTCQHLAAISLGVASLRRTATRNRRDAAILDDIALSLREAVKETRVLSYLMKPRGVGRNGLSATVLEFLEGFARRTGLEVALETDGAADGAPAPLQHAALRIIQEALINTNRHAQAHRVSVELTVDKGLLKLSIEDDGRGMRPDQREPGLGVGIPGMQARAIELSGELAISSDESGTRVVALLPLP